MLLTLRTGNQMKKQIIRNKVEKTVLEATKKKLPKLNVSSIRGAINFAAVKIQYSASLHFFISYLCKSSF